MTLDHLILAGPELNELAQLVRERLGIEPVVGGRHLGHGTHNALLGLGSGRYLELLAPDPQGAGGSFSDAIAHVRDPALHTWCASRGAADDVAERARAAGCVVRRQGMNRRLSDGSLLEWELVFVEGHPYGTLVPFFIDWRGSEHPSTKLKGGAQLEELVLAHPDPGGLAELLDSLGGLPLEARVEGARGAGLRASLRYGPRSAVFHGLAHEGGATDPPTDLAP